MPQSTSIVSYSYRRVVPVYPTPLNYQIPVNLPPSVSYPAGTIVGDLTGAAANDVQTVTITGSPTGGTFTLTSPNPNGNVASYTAAYNATPATVQTGLSTIFGGGNVTVTGTAGSSYVITFGGAYANRPVAVLTATGALTGGSSPAAAVAHTTTGATGGTFAAYAQGNSNGSQNPQLILEYDCATDADGNVTYGPAATGGQHGETYPTAPAYYAGVFNISDLPNYDANCAGKLGKLINNSQIRLF